jgi:hypothetical protein
MLERGRIDMLVFRLFSVLITLGLMTSPAFAQCDSAEELAQVAATRALVAQQCSCALAVTHGKFVRCAAQVANAELIAGRLDRLCRKVVVKCAGRSTCGRPPTYHPCCKTNRYGKTKCKTRLEEQCRSGPGGSHCMSFHQESCCDACIGPSCASPSGAFVDRDRDAF